MRNCWGAPEHSGVLNLVCRSLLAPGSGCPYAMLPPCCPVLLAACTSVAPVWRWELTTVAKLHCGTPACSPHYIQAGICRCHRLPHWVHGVRFRARGACAVARNVQQHSDMCCAALFCPSGSTFHVVLPAQWLSRFPANAAALPAVQDLPERSFQLDLPSMWRSCEELFVDAEVLNLDGELNYRLIKASAVCCFALPTSLWGCRGAGLQSSARMNCSGSRVDRWQACLSARRPSPSHRLHPRPALCRPKMPSRCWRRCKRQ